MRMYGFTANDWSEIPGRLESLSEVASTFGHEIDVSEVSVERDGSILWVSVARVK